MAREAQPNQPIPTDDGSNKQGTLGTCPHHWLIAPPNGRFSPAVCRLCGVSRDFMNYIEYEALNPEQCAKGGHVRHGTGTSLIFNPRMVQAELYRLIYTV